MTGPVEAVMRMLRSRTDRDGQAPALETAALGLGSTPDALAAADPSGRRDRGFGRPRDILDTSLSLKVLDGWLQNRHQILVPLAFRLDRLPVADTVLLMRFAGVVLLNASAADPHATRAAERWLEEVHAGDAGIAAFRAAILAPAPLSVLLAAVRDRNLEPYAYAVAVAAADTREATGHLFANYIAARLALPADAVRSIDRRFRR